MTEPTLGRHFREQQSNPQAGADRPGMFAGASHFSMVNPQFQAATNIQNIQNSYHTWNTNDVFAIRKWLKAPDPSTNFVAACDKRTPGTGEWIFSHPQFVEWREATSGILWIQGKVGSGKTFLSTAIIQELKADSASLCCYYYFDNRDNSQTKTNARGLLQSLLLQMATRSGGVHPALHGLYTKCTEGLMEPTTAELSATLEVVSKDLRPVYLVLDAMDECSEAFDVLKHLAHLKKNLCIAVTSRYMATDYDVSWYIHLDHTEYFHQDVAQYLEEKFRHRKLKPELLTEIVDQLREGAQGQFRWVDCQVTVLERCKTPKSMREALKKLPNTLEETYTLAIERMSKGEHVKDAGQLLMWLVYAFEPLSIAQVTEILAVDLEDQTFDPDMRSLELVNGTYDILDSTLITVNGGKVVKLAHNSVKEFLTQTHAEMHTSKVFKINEHLAHATICQTCVIYLLQFNKEGILPEEEETFGRLYPLGIYAAQHWPSHMQRLDDKVPDHKTAKDLIISLLKDSSQLTYVNWIRIHAPGDATWEESYDPTLDQTEIQSQLYYMASLNVLSILEHVLLEKLADVNSQGGQYGNALQVACLSGNKDIVQLLLEHKADVNTQGGEYGNALQAASFEGNKDIVQLLLEHKADVNAQGGKYGNALQAACSSGNKDIVQLLLEHNADVNAQGGAFGNALQAASFGGHKDIVQLLLEHKADVNAQGGEYGNALQAASRTGNKAIVQLLLEHKADINAQGGEYGNALQAAAGSLRRNTLDIVQLLLEHKADVNAQGGVFGNALQAACLSENKDIVQLLLEHKADVNAQGGEYGNALQAACLSGNKDIVQLLLEHKPDVNAHGGLYGNALQAACMSGNKDIVQLLLEHKPDVNAQGGAFRNALQAASWIENKAIVQLLLEHKADINAQGGKYGNALQAASWKGNKAIVQLLLEHKADINAQGGYYGNALQAAAISWRQNNLDIVQLLLEHKADVNAQGGQYGNALHAASFGEHKDIVQLLLEHKADVNAQGGKYGNALQAAAASESRSNLDIVQLLLEHKADVNAQGGQYGNALHAASIEGNKDIVQLLLEHKADVNAQGGKYGNALQAASWFGNKAIVQLLLDHKADVNAQGGKYGNALQAACFSGHKDIVQLLLEHKADVNAEGGEYGNALQAAAASKSRNNLDIVQLLLEHEADVNAQEGHYGNALHAASIRGNEAIVQLLLEHKAM